MCLIDKYQIKNDCSLISNVINSDLIYKKLGRFEIPLIEAKTILSDLVFFQIKVI